MADVKGRAEDAKDKVVGETKAGVGKVTDDKSKEAEGKAQSAFADVKSKARDFGDDVKEGAEKVGHDIKEGADHAGDKIKDAFDDVKKKFEK